MFRSVAFYLAIIGVIAAVVLARRQGREVRKEAPPPVAAPSKNPFNRSIGGSGLVEAEQENVRIAAPQPGLVTGVMVHVGSVVTTGTPLLQIDNRQVAEDVKVQQSQIPVLMARVQEADAILADKQDQFRRTGPLSQREVVSRTEGERTRYAVAQADAARLRARAELDQATATLQRSRVILDTLTVRAPRAGTVLQLNVRAGEYATPQASDPLILMGQIEHLQLRADIDEQNASRVSPGAEALAFVKGNSERSIPLEFVRIEPYILPKRSLTGLSTERVDTRVLQVIYRFTPPADLPVYVGQQMDIYIRDGQGRADSPKLMGDGPIRSIPIR